MAIIRNYNDIKSILTEKYIIREKEEKGFKFGATQSNSDESQKNKKPVATKRWNRFNSF